MWAMAVRGATARVRVQKCSLSVQAPASAQEAAPSDARASAPAAPAAAPIARRARRSTSSVASIGTAAPASTAHGRHAT
jgi:hypothetical protein